MSVYKRSYRSYSGGLTPAWSRFLVVTRYGMADAWRSRITTVLFVACMGPAVIAASMIYLMNSDAAKALLGMQQAFEYLKIDSTYFFRIFFIQSWFALVMTAWVGPRLMAPDLANNGLSLLLSRPISRGEYMAGKLAVLGVLLSAVTWVPGLLLFSLQAGLAESWVGPNLHIAFGLVLSGLLWILVLSLLVFAVAAWVKWRMLATLLVFALIFVPAGMGGMFNFVLNTRWGSAVNIPRLANIVWEWLMRVPRVHVPNQFDRDLPVPIALGCLVAIAAVCLWALHERIRGREVVRG